MTMLAEAPLKNAVPTDQELIDFVVREARLIDQRCGFFFGCARRAQLCVIQTR